MAVYAVVGDIGGAKEILPVVQILQGKYGAAVKWFVDSSPKAKAGTEVLDKAEIPYERRDPKHSDYPKVIVVGTSATAVESQIDWTRYGIENNIPVIWVEDLHGTGSVKNVRGVSPDLMVVVDEIASRCANAIRPSLKTSVLGKPSFANLPVLIEKAPEIRAVVRKELGLGEYAFLVHCMFGGEPQERAWTQVMELERRTYTIRMCLSMARNVFVMCRFHPKHPDVEELRERTASVLGTRFIDGARVKDAQHAVIASDFLFSEYSANDQFTGLLAGVPVGTLLFPYDCGWRIERGYPEGVPPILIGREEWGVASIEKMSELVCLAVKNHEFVKETTENRAKPFRTLLEPGAAERIADVVKSYLN